MRNAISNPIAQLALRAARRHATAVLAVASAAAIALWRVWRPILRTALQLLLALVVIFEEWGWQPLSAALARLARFKPWAMAEQWIAGLPPYGALAAFALPMTLLFPLKLLAVYLFANGKVLLGTGLLIGAKLTSTAFVARIFALTKPALMRIGWFARAYAWFVPWEEAALAWLRSSWAWRVGRVVKHRTVKGVQATWRDLKPRLQGLAARARAAWADIAPRLKALSASLLVSIRATARRLLGGRRLL